MLIYYLHDSHGTHQEEQCSSCLAKVLLDSLAQFDVEHLWQAHNGEHCPANHTHQQCNGSLVDLRHTLNGNKEIADNERDDNRKC